jgi:cytochrome c5
MSRISSFVFIVFCCLATCLPADAQAQATQSVHSKGQTKSATTAAASEGEKRFRTNCVRCHNAPEQLSPREVRAVLRQMRVRAMLSAEDEKLIREYLAP